MPNEQSRVQWQVCNPYGRRDYLRKPRRIGMRLEELGVRWKQAGIESLFNSGQINLGILRVRVISVNQEHCDREQDENPCILPFGNDQFHWGS